MLLTNPIQQGVLVKMKDDLLRTIEKYDMLKRGDGVVVAVSGGPDSVCLLLSLVGLQKKFSLKLYIAHLNHGFRRKEAQKDAAFVARLAKKYNLPLITKEVNIPRIKKSKKGSPEEIARQVRYKFLLETACDAGAKKIATGHTTDDQAETVLLRLTRGCGLKGLGGIPPTRKLDNCLIIRPLIETSRSQIDKYLKRKKVSARTDSSNLKPLYKRNVIRLKLIPLLEKNYNSNIKAVLANMAEGLRADFQCLEEKAAVAFRKCTTIRKDGACAVLIPKLNRLPEALKRQVLVYAVKEIKKDLKDIEYRHFQYIEDFCSKAGKNISMCLPSGIRVKKIKGGILFEVGAVKKKNPRELNTLVNLIIPGITKLPSIRTSIKAGLLKKPPLKEQLLKNKRIKYLDAKRVHLPLSVKTRCKADRFKPMGMKRSVKLKNFFINAKIQKERRSSVPLIISRKKIVCVGNLRISEDVKVTPRTTKTLRLIIEKY